MRKFVVFLALFFAFCTNVWAKNSCLTNEESKKLIATINSSVATAENEKLRKELLAMRLERETLNEKITADTAKNQNLIPEMNALGEKHLARVCQIINENGWLTKESVKDDGFDAFLFLVSNNRNIQAQRELFPVFVEAAKKDLVGKPFIASLIDGIRVGVKQPQIFGTQAAIRNNIVYLYPLLNDERVNEWRKNYEMPPLRNQILDFEERYVMPVLKSHPQIVKAQNNNEKNSDTEILGINEDENEAIKIDTKLVNVNVSVFTKDLKTPIGLNLTKDDFSVLENGVEQEISFFSNTDQPFDLVLLLDFSASTEEKQGMIKKSAQRFVELARPTDRIAVVVFATDILTVSELTDDKKALNQKIKDIKIYGGSPIWDSVQFVYDNIFKEKNPNRRTAIVLMTDGEDYSLKTTFADLVETVRRGETTIFPVYLGREKGFDNWRDRNIRKWQQTLSILADESGGQFYKAKDVKDLSAIYAEVIKNLGQIYSIGYEPKNEMRDGSWRTLSVKIKSQTDLVTKTRQGYYAN